MSANESASDQIDNTAFGYGPALTKEKDMDFVTSASTDGLKANGPLYRKDLTVCVEMIGEDRITMMELLRGIKEVCGNVTGCRFKTPTKYEVTMNKEEGKTRLMDGFKIRNTRIMARDLGNDELVVSFMNLPVYTADVEI